MAYNKYLNEMTTLLKNIRPKLLITHRLEFKNVFGAVGGYIRGRIFASCGRFGIAFRLPSDTLNTFFKAKKAKRLRYFPKGHIKKEYAILSKQVLQNEQLLKKVVDKSIKYVTSLTNKD